MQKIVPLAAVDSIGLALSYQLARQMDGSLELESTAASGTIFCISIPVS